MNIFWPSLIILIDHADRAAVQMEVVKKQDQRQDSTGAPNNYWPPIISNSKSSRDDSVLITCFSNSGSRPITTNHGIIPRYQKPGPRSPGKAGNPYSTRSRWSWVATPMVSTSHPCFQKNVPTTSHRSPGPSSLCVRLLPQRGHAYKIHL